MATSEAADEEVRSQVEVDPAGNGEATQLQEPEDEQLLQNVTTEETDSSPEAVTAAVAEPEPTAETISGDAPVDSKPNEDEAGQTGTGQREAEAEESGQEPLVPESPAATQPASEETPEEGTSKQGKVLGEGAGQDREVKASEQDEPGEETGQAKAPGEGGEEKPAVSEDGEKNQKESETEGGKTASTEAKEAGAGPDQSTPLAQSREASGGKTASTSEKETADQSMALPQSREASGGQTQEKGNDRDKKKDRHKDRDKKQRKKAKQSTEEGSRALTQLRKRSTKSQKHSRKSTLDGTKQVEAILVSVYQPFDPDGSGYVDSTVFWEVLQSVELNLQLSEEHVAALQGLIEPDRSGQIPYAQFATHGAEYIASLYHNQPASEAHWVDLQTADGSLVISYNKQTGEVRDPAEAGIDLFEDFIKNMYQLADTEGRGYITKEEFLQLLQSEQMITYLSADDVEQMQQYFAAIPSGQATYTDFYPMAKELILRVYRVKDPSESEWCQLNSPRVGLFWFNKYTGETRREAASDEREQEIAFVTQAYAQVEAVNFELEQYKQECRDLQNQLAQANEEQEALATQLYETGHALDEATAEIQAREEEVVVLKDVIESKDQEIEEFTGKVDEYERLKERLVQTELELQSARETIAARDRSIEKQKSSIREMQREREGFTNKLKSVTGVVDARDSTLSGLQHQLRLEKERTREFEKQVPALEGQLSAMEDELRGTKGALEEKVTALGQARRHLKNARERNMELERQVEKLGQTQEKLRNTESEIHTLKSFLTSKTALVERRKKELQDTRMKVAQLEAKDSRRAVILADVLEKTARQYQKQLAASSAAASTLTTRTMLTPYSLTAGERPASAPPIPPNSGSVPPPAPASTEEYPRVLKTFTMGRSAPSTTDRTTKSPKKRIKGRSRTVPKLPPIHRPPQKKAFVFPTTSDLKLQHRQQDDAVVEHSPSNPQCSCELCRMNASIGALGTGYTGLTAPTGLSGYREEMDSRETMLTQQVAIGQRVLVRMKKSEFDLEPQKLTGIVRYVGKIDSEFVDNRIYVGLKLDEAVGDTDGLIKGKRYFTCPLKHGKVVRITNVIAVLPSKSVFYKPVQNISKRSPYTTTQQKSATIRVT